LYEHHITSAATVTISGNVVIDEIRLCPKGAFMETFTYTALVGQTSHTNPLLETVFYEYDSLGRLCAIRDKNRLMVKAYHYQIQQPSNR
jgi:YD repeat-containing protein